MKIYFIVIAFFCAIAQLSSAQMENNFDSFFLSLSSFLSNIHLVDFQSKMHSYSFHMVLFARSLPENDR